MAETENKVQFNLKNVHYAVLESDNGQPQWLDPVKVPGAVNLNLAAQGEVTPFYADGIVYYQSSVNNGYSGDLEMARFPEKMHKDVWGVEETETDAVLIENSSVEPKPFALLFQIDGNISGEYFLMYNCSGRRPGVVAKTNQNTKEPQTQTSTISAVSLENGMVMARTTSRTPKEVKDNWFKAVYLPKPPAETKEETGE